MGQQEVAGLVAVAGFGVIGAVFAPVETVAPLFAMLSAIGGFIAGRMNGQASAARAQAVANR